MTLEEKIHNKVKNIFEWTTGQDMTKKSNQDKFFEMITESVTRIAKKEVNVRLQEIRHNKPKE
ncbi:hypothetical protein LCGC14_2364850 [marine sediment metagenome]|uniref:Uncharacterized protein n=1 Tax=marine sediment metagenome TaxID=412755 RepID=A0A0F9EI03_9ZZZZ